MAKLKSFGTRVKAVLPMDTAKSLFPVLGWAALSAVALIVAVVGEGSDRLLGIAFVLITVVGIPAATVAQRLNRPREEAIRTELIRFRGSYREAVVCHYSKRKHWAAFVGSCAIAVSGALMFTVVDTADDFGDRWLLRGSGLAIAVMFGSRALYDVYVRWGSGHYVALSPDGILHQALRPIFVPWAAVEAVGVFEWQRTRGAGVRLSTPRAVRAPWWVRRSMRSNRRLYGVDLVFADFEASPDDLAEAIQRQLGASREAAAPSRG